MALKLVPFNDAWIQHDKIDIHAIYRRPRYVEDKYGEMEREYKDGVATWDLTGPLPVRHHNRWRSKGFEYVTLANRDSLLTAARFGTLPPGHKAADYDQHQTGGPWNYKKYAEGQENYVTLEAEQLKADVEQFGSEAVETLRRRTDADFKLPDALRGFDPGGRRKKEKADDRADAKAAEAK